MNSFSAYSGAERRNHNSFDYFGIERRTTAWESQPGGEERALVERAIAHDQEAFTRLYDRFVDKIYRYIYYKVGSRAEAEDLTAQVFLKAWEAIDKYRWTQRPFSAWLYRIAHNMTIDYFRTRRETTNIDDLPALEGPHVNPEELSQQRLTADIIWRAIKRLTPEQERVIILRFLEDMPIEQVALIMGKQPGAVRTLQHRALHALAGIFQRGSEKP